MSGMRNFGLPGLGMSPLLRRQQSIGREIIVRFINFLRLLTSSATFLYILRDFEKKSTQLSVMFLRLIDGFCISRLFVNADNFFVLSQAFLNIF